MAVTPTKGGRWKVVVDVGSARADGSRKRVTRTVDSEAEGLELQAQLRGRAPDLIGMTVTGLCEQYIMLRAQLLDPQTDNLYRGFIKRYIRPNWFGDMEFTRVDRPAVMRFYNELRDGSYLDGNPVAKRARRRPPIGLAEKTLRGIHMFVASVFNDAADQRWIDRAPTKGARTKGIEKRANRTARHKREYDLGDIARIRAAAYHDDARELIHFGVITGARIAEVAAVRWRDISFTDSRVLIDSSVSRTRDTDAAKRGQYFRKSTKTGDSRDLTLDPSAMRMLTDRFARHVQQAEDAGVPVESLDDRAVFSRTLEVGFTSPGALRGWWTMARTKAGVPGLVFHDLRHIACSEMQDAGVPIGEATARSGHDSRSVYFDVYGDRRRRTSDPALDALSATWAKIVNGSQQ